QSESSIDLDFIGRFHVEAGSVDLDGNFYGMSSALILANLMFMGQTQPCNDSRHRTQNRHKRGEVGEPFFNSCTIGPDLGCYLLNGLQDLHDKGPTSLSRIDGTQCETFMLQGSSRITPDSIDQGRISLILVADEF